MSGLKILITSFLCARRTGLEVYVRDLALGLQERGHLPIVYSTHLGEVAEELRSMMIPVVDDLSAIAVQPDVIHGQHHIETMTALLHFPGVPAIYFCHNWFTWLDSPPRFPRLLRYVAADQPCYEKLVFEHAVPEERAHLLLHFVDMERFKPRAPLPARPQRASVYSSYSENDAYLAAVRQAYARAGLRLDDAEAEGRAAAAYIRLLASRVKEQNNVLDNSAVVRLKKRVLKVPVAGKPAQSLAHLLVCSSP